ncbi:VOC family protein [Mycoplasmatota bacterium]|nr:VOC family protein [Mycoplasmatota bacterium]
MEIYHESKTYIKHVNLAVFNLSVSESFYNEVMHLDTLSKTDETVILGNRGNPLITLVKSRKRHQFQEGLYHIAFLLENEDQLATWISLNRRFPNFLGASHHGVSKAIYLEDPDGHGIEVYADLDDTKWHYESNEIQMVTLPLDIDELLMKSMYNDQFKFTIGHLHLRTKNVEKAAEFYRLLGFKMTLDLRSAVFMSFNHYHHHLALNSWNLHDKEEHDEEVADIRAYEIWYDSKLAFDSARHMLDHQEISYQEEGKTILLKDPLNIQIKLTY